MTYTIQSRINKHFCVLLLISITCCILCIQPINGAFVVKSWMLPSTYTSGCLITTYNNDNKIILTIHTGNSK